VANNLSEVEIHYEKSGFRLPTEAEWEFACRAGSPSEYYWGNDTNDIGNNCWYVKNSKGSTHKVGLKKPNSLGLFDMSGNVWEWCNDWYEEYRSEDTINPIGPETGSYRVLRGGSWYDDARDGRCAYRYWNGPDSRYDNVGFRVVFVP
jgi:formylglycine-generating enzyme required for sulfatase activity